MGMAVNTNLSALNAHRNLSNTQNDLSKSLEKLSSGLRINRAADDAAGLSISEGLRSQVNGMTVAARNAQDGISVLQTAEGALGEVQSILQRVRDLTVQAGNDSNNAESRTAIKTEIDALGDELTRMASTINFNGTKLLDGSQAFADPAAPAVGEGLTFQVGAGSAVTEQITVGIQTNLTTLGTTIKALDVTDATTSLAAIGTVDTAITAISTDRSTIGAGQNRLETTINSLNVSRENLQAAESRIRDVDMAAEMVSFTRSNILSQAGTAMLAQANQSNQGVLQLLG